MSIQDVAPRGRRGELAEREEEWFPLTSFRREMDRLFDDFFRGAPRLGWLTTGDGTLSPRVDISETDTEVKVSAELPGLDEKDIEVNVRDNTLTIKGEKKAEKEEKGKTFYRSERSYGLIQRVIPLPVEVQQDKAEAEFSKGVLTVRLPKSPAAQKKSRKIEIVAKKG
jgi:HSP20 family protein